MTTGPGLIRMVPRCYRSDERGRIGDEITELVTNGEVNVDVEAEVPMTFRADLIDPDAIAAWTWIRPFLALHWFDVATGADVTVTEPVGHFLVLPRAERQTAAMGLATIDGVDGCWRLKQSCYETAPKWAAGANVVAAITSVLTSGGIDADRIHIPARSNTFLKKRAYEPGTDRLTIVNDLLMRIGNYPVWFDRDGVAMSRRIVPLNKVEPRRELRSDRGDIIGVVELDTDVERLCNRVVVVGNDPKEDTPIVVAKTNRRPDSPASIANLGFVKSRLIEGSNVETTADATSLANQALEEGASVERRVRLATIPDAAFGFRETIRLKITRDDGVEILDGRWWWNALRIGFTPAQQPQSWTLNKLVAWSDDL
jgi:hypothetical protein